MADPKRERRNTPHGGVNERDVAKAITKGQIARDKLEYLTPFFDEFRKIIFEKWEACSATDVENLRALKYQLLAVNQLIKAMKLQITHGKQAAEKINE